ncbi:MAG: hypothetical protein K6L75_03440 [Cellvibrionaceae bacterium]
MSSGTGQSHKMSMIESAVSVIAGYILNVLFQFFLYPAFGIEISLDKAFIIAFFITGLAFVKNYGVRRFFNLLHLKSLRAKSL